MADLRVLPGVVIPERELSWVAVRASGAGGQNVNKVSSKVELRFDFEASIVLPQPVKARLRALSRSRLDAAGRLVLSSQLTRNQPQNLADARARLARLVAAAFVMPKRRRATSPTRGSQRARLANKRAHSQKKQDRARRDD